MPNLKDMSGKKFGRLTVVSRAENYRGGAAMWNCRCECGRERPFMGQSLRSGAAKSCGCLCKEINLKRITKHGKHKTRLYRIWSGMKNRCYLKSHGSYIYYGGRGINICKEWTDNFSLFYKWSVDNGYSDNLTIDRINTYGNYEPDNCRWITMREQHNNTRASQYLESDGEIHTLADWARIKGLSRKTIHARFRRGWATERILSPIKQKVGIN